MEMKGVLIAYVRLGAISRPALLVIRNVDQVGEGRANEAEEKGGEDGWLHDEKTTTVVGCPRVHSGPFIKFQYGASGEPFTPSVLALASNFSEIFCRYLFAFWITVKSCRFWIEASS
jgi:hypothetical protein